MSVPSSTTINPSSGASGQAQLDSGFSTGDFLVGGSGKTGNINQYLLAGAVVLALWLLKKG